MTTNELRRAAARREDVSESDVREQLDGSDAEARVLAATAVYHSRLRQSVDALGELCGAQHYADSGTLNLLGQLAAISDNPFPVLAARKGVGLRMLAAGDIRGGIATIESAQIDGNHIGSRVDYRSRRGMRFLHDPEIDEAYERVGRMLDGAPGRGQAAPQPYLGIIGSTLVETAATTVGLVSNVEGLIDNGYRVRVLLSAHTPTGESWAMARLASLGVPVWTAPLGNPVDRVVATVAELARDPVDLMLFYTWPMDAVGQIASVTGLAPRQIFLNHTCESRIGRFDAIVQPVRDSSHSYRPELCRYVTPASIAAERVEAAAPADRARYGVRNDQLLLGTYGRLSKCVERSYTDALSRVLRHVPEAVLVLPGLPDPASEAEIRAAFTASGVIDRVRFPGFLKEEYFRLLKATDIYFDTFSWTGGQSIIDAMVAGVPIVANLPTIDPDFDPTGTSSISIGGTLLHPDVPVAPPLDVDAYVAIALEYIREPEKRLSDAVLNRAAASDYRPERYATGLDVVIREVLAR